jgi:8-oxo-dGTP pyrophosphatase MutT (NUDIX family)
LLLPLPGERAQNKMVPKGIRNFPQNDNPPSSAAVLLLIFPVNSEPYTVFIKRTEYPGVHSGQISLPGGRIEATDVDLQHTALRETSEELGISSDNIKIIGKLSPLFIPVSRFEVNPYVGYTNYKPDWKPDFNEVTYAIETSIKELSSPQVVKSEIWHIHGNNLNVPFYHVKNEKIWGATAMIIAEFLEMLI